MNYSLAFLIVAASAILVTSMHPAEQAAREQLIAQKINAKTRNLPQLAAFINGRSIAQMVAGSSNAALEDEELIDTATSPRWSSGGLSRTELGARIIKAHGELIVDIVEALERDTAARGRQIHYPFEVDNIKKALKMVFSPNKPAFTELLNQADVCKRNVNYTNEQMALQIYSALPNKLENAIRAASVFTWYY